MSTKQIKDFGFIKEWVRHNTDVFETMYPEIDRKELKKFIRKVAEERVVNPKAKLHNNYAHREIDIDLLTLIDWFDEMKPIAAGFGVFFKDQSRVKNPAAVMLNNFMTLRKDYKKRLKDLPEGSYEYQTFDRLQLTEKINANSFYGAGGAKTSEFYNVYTATSVTATGQSLISTTQQAFEAFLGNNSRFFDLNEAMTFMENIRKEKYSINENFLPNISVERLLQHLEKMFVDIKSFITVYKPILQKYLERLSQQDLNRIFFKNNIYAFSALPRIGGLIDDIMTKTIEFKDPNLLPSESKKDIEKLWSYYREFVFYNHSPIGRIDRLKTEKRRIVVTVDTDSNMLNLNPWMTFLYKYVISVNDDLMGRDPDGLRFIGINLMCYVITNMITDVLVRYTKISNIPKEYHPMINMKNEFLFTRLMLSEKKKRYASSVRLREGVEIYPEKIDVKGMDFVKSSTRDETKEFFMQILKDDILHAKEIDISKILRKLESFESIIRESLQKGEKNFLIPKSVKEVAAYQDPYREQGIRGVIVWNAIYPDQTIELPEKLDIIKVNLTTKEEALKLREVNEKYYDIIMKRIFGSHKKKVAKKGVQIIALPRNVERIPDWIIPFIDYDTIVNDNLSRFYSVLKSLGIQTISTTKAEYFSNILKI